MPRVGVQPGADAPRATAAANVPRHPNVSLRGDKLIAKLDRLKDDLTPGSFSLSFTEVSGGSWRNALVGVGAVDKLEHGLTQGRKMKAYLMVRVTGKGMKANAQGQRTKRVPAFGVKPIVADTLSDLEGLLKSGPKAAKEAWKKKTEKARASGRSRPRRTTTHDSTPAKKPVKKHPKPAPA